MSNDLNQLIQKRCSDSNCWCRLSARLIQIALLCLACFATAPVHATTWATAYPYTQRTEQGMVLCRSVPYCARGPFDQGETFVYRKGKLLYSIGKYISTALFTFGEGRYLIEVDFEMQGSAPEILWSADTTTSRLPKTVAPDGASISIYDMGQPLRRIMFSELGIDGESMHRFGFRRFTWRYGAAEPTGSQIEARMARQPAFMDGDRLCLIASDEQLIEVSIPSGAIVGRSMARETLGSRDSRRPQQVKRKYVRTKYPEKFFLPKLKDGRSLDLAASSIAKIDATQDTVRIPEIQVYLHTLLINRQGRCEVVHASVSEGKMGGAQHQLEQDLSRWLQQQEFDTRTIPRGFDKFKYTGFLTLSPR